LTAPADVPFLPLDLTVRLCGHMHVPEPDVLTVRREHALGVWSVKLAADLRRAILKEGMRRVEEFARRHRLRRARLARRSRCVHQHQHARRSLARRKLGWLELDHVPSMSCLPAFSKFTVMRSPDHRLDLAKTPVRPTRMADEVAGREQGISGFFRHGGVKFP